MEKVEFEKKFLELVNRSDLVITAANVAYAMELPIEETQDHLLALELNGTLQQETDKQGNAYYQMPHRAQPGALARADEKSPQTGGSQAIQKPGELSPAPIYSGPGSAPARGKNVNGLVLNVIFPGLGSLVSGRIGSGLAMGGLLLAGLVLMLILPRWSKLIGVLPIFASWVWSVIAGVQLLDEREAGPGLPAKR